MEHEGLASLADMEAGGSGSPHVFFASSLRFSSPKKGRITHGFSHFSRFNGGVDSVDRHFLDTCFFCQKPLGHNKDIFMYKGNIPFCSEECREEQMCIDEDEEKNRSVVSSINVKKKKTKYRGYHCWAGTVVAG